MPLKKDTSLSFIIAKKYLEKDQIKAIRNYKELGKFLGINFNNETWEISENDLFITGFTKKGSPVMREFLCNIGINKKAIDFAINAFEMPDNDNLRNMPKIEDCLNWRKYIEQFS